MTVSKSLFNTWRYFFDSMHFRLCPAPSGGFLEKEARQFNFIWLKWNGYNSSIQFHIVWSFSSFFKLKCSLDQGWYQNSCKFCIGKHWTCFDLFCLNSSRSCVHGVACLRNRRIFLPGLTIALAAKVCHLSFLLPSLPPSYQYCGCGISNFAKFWIFLNAQMDLF